mmetsp:Transcript_6262/g.20041  ORF Transcript_6262/g.20041 Transcript_6262/m.20041 type:complete len:334 (+) Transcript_6262:3-1004(+)
MACSFGFVAGAVVRSWPIMMLLLLSSVTGFSSLRPTSSTPVTHVARYAASPRSVTMHGGKGFGGGEATRDPPPTVYDPSDPKGKQQAIHKAESFAEYLAKRGGFSDSHKSGVCEPRGAAAATAVSKVAPATAPASGSPYAKLADAYVADIRRELALLMDNPSWDDGSLAPVLIRLAWHSSGTYDKASGTGGSNGAGMRFDAEASDCENAGLHTARAFLEPVKKKFPGISYSDLWVLAAYVGIEHTGGPSIAFRPGRVDWEGEHELLAGGWCNPMPQGGHGRLPGAEKYVAYDSTDADGRPSGWQKLCGHIRDEVFRRLEARLVGRRLTWDRAL